MNESQIVENMIEFILNEEKTSMATQLAGGQKKDIVPIIIKELEKEMSSQNEDQ